MGNTSVLVHDAASYQIVFADRLARGQRFSLDSGTTWHTFGEITYGAVLVHVDSNRDPENSLMRRVEITPHARAIVELLDHA